MLTIITINLNDREGLRRTFASVFAQDTRDFEYVVVDGASSDGSVEEIRANQGRITWWTSERDTGIYNAMNIGIRQATGEHCLFLNSGDRLVGSDAVSRISAALAPGIDVLYSDARLVKAGRTRIDRSPRHITPGYFLINTLNHQNTVIRRSLLLEEGLYREDLRIASDWYLFLKASSRRNLVFRRLAAPMVEYDNEGLSSTPDGAALNLREREACIKELFPDCLPMVEELRAFQDSRYGSIIRHFGYPRSLDLMLRAYRILLRVFRSRDQGEGR